jgi:tetratricopeptide (TPR) repeat protein
VSIGRLPATGRELFGREADLAWLDGCWREGVQVASVVAFGGVGKTALVNRWLAGMRDRGWDGARRVYGWSFYSQGTERLGSSDEFLAEALRWFGEPDMGRVSAWDKGERLAEVVGRERSLLVLDGVEPLQWGPGVQEGRFKDQGIEALLKGLGVQNEGMCLVTSRIGLADLEGVGGDKVVTRDLRFLEPEAGAELLRSRGVVGTQEELVAASKEYWGHGLALTLLGSYLVDVGEGDVRKRHEIGPLERDERQGSHARQVMQKYETWLGKPELAMLHMIGLFDRPAGEGEIGALRAEPPIPGLTDGLAGVGARDWNKALAKLCRAGLLLAEEPDKRLDAHPLVREHFGEQLRSVQPEAWREGHRRLYEHLKAAAKELPETIEEMRPLYAAVVHGCLAGKNQEALLDVYMKRIHRGNEWYGLRTLGAFGSDAAVLSAFFDPPWERLAPGLSDSSAAHVVANTGLALRALGRLPEAAGLMRLSLEMGIAQQDWKQSAIGASNLSGLLQSHGDLSEALTQARTSADLADRSGEDFLRAQNRAQMAAILHALGRREESLEQFQMAERMQMSSWSVTQQLEVLPGAWYCDLILDHGGHADVRERILRSRARRKSTDSLLALALDHLSLGRAHLLAAQCGPGGDLAAAVSYLTQAVDGLRRAGQQDYLPLGLLARAAFYTYTGALTLAHRDLAEALSLSTRCGFRLHLTDAHLGYARLHLAEGRLDLARPHLGAARALIAETSYHRRDAELAALEATLSPDSAPQLRPEEGVRDPSAGPRPSDTAAPPAWVLAARGDPLPLDEPSTAVPGRLFLAGAGAENPRDLLRDTDTASAWWRRSEALLHLITGPRTGVVGGIELDLHREAAVRTGLALDAEREQSAEASDGLRFEVLALHHGATLAHADLPGDPARRVRAAWLYGDRIGRFMRESLRPGADPRQLAAELEEGLPAASPEDPDALWPARLGTGPTSLRLDEVWLLHALFLAHEVWEPPGPVLDALRRLAARPINDAERDAEQALEAGHDVLGWPGAHLAPPLAARWLLHAWRAQWLATLPVQAQIDTIEWLERWLDGGHAARGGWVMLALHREAAGLSALGDRARALWTKTLATPGDVAERLGEALGPFCLWGATYLDALTCDRAEALAALAVRTPAAWRVGVLLALAETPMASGRAREALLALVGSDEERELRLPAAIAALQLARRLPEAVRGVFLPRVVDSLSPELRNHPNIRVELKRVGRAA